MTLNAVHQLLFRRLIKVLHEIGAIGVTGTFATCLVMAMKKPEASLLAYAAVREEIALITQWLMMPSLALVIVSGFIAMLLQPAYYDAGWAWVKAALGLSLFEGTLVTVGNAAHRAAQLSALAATEHTSTAELLEAVHAERMTLWMLLAVCCLNIVLAVWRPRFIRAG
jgi:Predicted integral membrane protein (DUF2269)